MRQHQFTFQDIVDAIGETAAAALVSRHGGTSIAVPAKLKPGVPGRGGAANPSDDLIEVIGEVAAVALVANCGRINLYIPHRQAQARDERNRVIIAKFDRLTAGAGAFSARAVCSQLAREFHLSDGTIWRILKRGPATPNP